MRSLTGFQGSFQQREAIPDNHVNFVVACSLAVSVITSKSLRPKIMVSIVLERKITENLTKWGKMLPLQHIFKANVAQGCYFEQQI